MARRDEEPHVWEPTTGTALLDLMIDDVRIGDNLVLQGDTSAPLDLLVERFVAAARSQVPLVVVNLATPWHGEGWQAELPTDTVVLDWSPVLTGLPSTLDGALRPDAGLDDALAQLIASDDRVGTGAAFVFDRLTAVQEAWGEDAPLELFLTACPRLYRRRSLALWPVERDAHGPAFLRRLAEITQVVIELADDGGQLRATVIEADGRSGEVTGRSLHVEVADGDLRDLGTSGSPPRVRLGTVIRDQRLVRGLSQVELARRVGITPSALSQVERGVRGPSGDTLMRLWEVLGVPFGPSETGETGYHVDRRSGRDRTRLDDGLTGERVADDPATGTLWRLEAAPGASSDRAVFVVKSPEVVTVVRGVLDLQLGGRTETLHEGDALVATDASITGWSNPGPSVAELLWTVHPTR